MGSVRFEFTTRDTDLDKSYQKLERENAKLRGDLDKVRRASQDSNNAGKRGLSDNIDLTNRLRGSITAMATSWFGATQAIAAYNTERQRQIDLDNKGKEVQLTVAQAEAALVKNFGDAPATEINSFIASLEKVNSSKGFGNLAAILQASATTLSATGGNRDLTRGLISEGASIFRDDPTQLPVFASALGDVARIMDAKSSDDFKRAMGLVLSTQGVARIEDLKSFENVAPALASVANVDTSGNRLQALKEGSAVFAAIGGEIGDKQGAITKTAVIALSSQLQQLLPENDIVGPGGKILREGTGLQSLGQRIRRVQSDVELQRQFFYGGDNFSPASFRGDSYQSIVSLLGNPDSPIAQAFTRNQSAINPDPSLVDRLNINLGSTPRGRLGKVQSQLNTMIERYSLADEEGARRAIVREAYDELSQRASPGAANWADRAVARLFFEGFQTLGMSPEYAGRTAIESMAPNDRDLYEAVRRDFFDLMSEIEVNTRNGSALPDQMNSQGQRR